MLRLAAVLSFALLALAPLAPAGPRALAARTASPHPWFLVLGDEHEPGERFFISGRVFALPDSQPLANAQVRVYHADDRGRYAAGGEARPRLDGSVRTNANGEFFVRTVLPGMAEGMPHVHWIVTGEGIDEQAGSLNLARMHGAGSDTTYGRLPYMLSGGFTWVEPAADGGLRASCRLYVRRTKSD